MGIDGNHGTVPDYEAMRLERERPGRMARINDRIERAIGVISGNRPLMRLVNVMAQLMVMFGILSVGFSAGVLMSGIDLNDPPFSPRLLAVAFVAGYSCLMGGMCVLGYWMAIYGLRLGRKLRAARKGA